MVRFPPNPKASSAPSTSLSPTTAPRAQLFDAFEVKGFIAGSQYDADAGASAMANLNTDTFLNSINPGNSIKAIVLIDVPAGRQLETVELRDSLFSAGTSVSVK